MVYRHPKKRHTAASLMQGSIGLRQKVGPAAQRNAQRQQPPKHQRGRTARPLGGSQAPNGKPAKNNRKSVEKNTPKQDAQDRGGGVLHK